MVFNVFSLNNQVVFLLTLLLTGCSFNVDKPQNKIQVKNIHERDLSPNKAELLASEWEVIELEKGKEILELILKSPKDDIEDPNDTDLGQMVFPPEYRLRFTFESEAILLVDIETGLDSAFIFGAINEKRDITARRELIINLLKDVQEMTGNSEKPR